MTPETERVCVMIKGAIQDEATAGPMYKTIVDNMPKENLNKYIIEGIMTDEHRHKKLLLDIFSEMKCE